MKCSAVGSFGGAGGTEIRREIECNYDNFPVFISVLRKSYTYRELLKIKTSLFILQFRICLSYE